MPNLAELVKQKQNEKEKQKFEEKPSKPKKPEDKKPKSPKTPNTLVIPNHIKMLFDNIDKSISSIWGLQKNGKIK